MYREKIKTAIGDKAEVLNLVAALAEKRGARAWLVGGMVRDALMGRPSTDADIAVSGDAVLLATELAERIGGTYIPLHEELPTGRVVKGSVQYDITALRAPTIEADLLERDMTVNSIAVSLTTHGPYELFDPTGGLDDLEGRIVRTIAKKNLLDDPLRALRVYRFMAQLDFKVDPTTRAWAGLAAPGLATVAGERILFEMTRLLSTPRAAPALKLAFLDGVASAVIPEIMPLMEQSEAAPRDLNMLDHAFEVVRLLDEAAERLPDLPAGVRAALAEDPIASDPVAMKLAALFHDRRRIDAAVAPDEKSVLGGIGLLSGLCARWKVSNRLRKSVRGILETQPAYLQCAKEVSFGTDKLRAFARYTREANESWLAAPVLLLAIMNAARMDATFLRLHALLIGDLIRVDRETIRSIDEGGPLLDGNEIMRILGIEPGPVVGRILDALREERIAGAVTDRSGAVEFCKKILPELEGK